MATLIYQGAEYHFDFEHVSAPEYREIKRKLGVTIRQFIEGTEQLDIDAVTALRWVVLRSDGKHDDLVLDAAGEFDVFEFLEAWASYGNAKKAEKEAADPTLAGSLPATTTPGSTGSSTGTSAKSPASTSSSSPGTAGSANGKPAGSPSPVSSAT